MSVYCCKTKTEKAINCLKKSQNSHDFEKKQTKQFKIKENKAKRTKANTHNRASTKKHRLFIFILRGSHIAQQFNWFKLGSIHTYPFIKYLAFLIRPCPSTRLFCFYLPIRSHVFDERTRSSNHRTFSKTIVAEFDLVTSPFSKSSFSHEKIN